MRRKSCAELESAEERTCSREGNSASCIGVSCAETGLARKCKYKDIPLHFLYMDENEVLLR